jgi:hypothetical protein
MSYDQSPQTPFYKGNTEIKKKGVVLEYTPEQVAEIVKCQNDIVYFLSKYVYIISLDEGKILFEPYYFQNNLLQIFRKNRFTVATLSRQMGKTITVCAFLLYEAIFNKDYAIAILANNAFKSREILGRLKLMYELLPWWIKPGVVEWNKGSIEFSNGSKIFAGPTTNSSIRGFSINCVYLDEFAFVENDVEFFTSTYPVIASGKKTKIIITSTPRGMNLFYKLYTDAVNGRNEFFPVKYTWECHPDRDEVWKLETIRNTSVAQFRQEHACEFLGSSDTLISGECLERLTYLNPIESTDSQSLYKKPVDGHIYVISVDVGEGVGRDYTTAVVIDITTKPYEQVFVYRKNDISPWLVTGPILKIAQKYNQAHILVENNSIGKIVADELFYEHDYDNVVSSKVKNGSEVFTAFSSKSFGITMNRKTKMLGCSALKALIEEGFLNIFDFTTIQELSCFVKTRNSYEAEKGKHDDLVMPLVGFAWLTTQNMFEDLSVSGMDELLKEARERESDNSFIVGFYDDGIEYAEKVINSRIWNS